jgi:hypothetical protein
MPKHKSFLEKAGLIERVDNTSDYDPAMYEGNEPEREESPSPFTGMQYDNERVTDELLEYAKEFISKSYEQEDLKTEGSTIFKLEEIRATLPDTLTTEMKRESVMKTLAIFGISLDELLSDGNDRISTLKNYYDKYLHEREDEVRAAQQEIEEAKKLIQEKDLFIKESHAKVNAVQDTVKGEIGRITGLFEFISPGSDIKEGAE